MIQTSKHWQNWHIVCMNKIPEISETNKTTHCETNICDKHSTDLKALYIQAIHYFSTSQLRPTLWHYMRDKQPWHINFSTLWTTLPIKIGIKMAHTIADLLFTRYDICAAFSSLDMVTAEKPNYISQLSLKSSSTAKFLTCTTTQ